MIEEVALHLEDVHDKFYGIISKDRVIKDQVKRIGGSIVSEKNIYVMCAWKCDGWYGSEWEIWKALSMVGILNTLHSTQFYSSMT